MRQNQKTEFEYGKIPPQAVEAEEAVLGATLLEPGVIDLISPIIDTPIFYKESHQRIFEVIKTISAKKEPIDLITVTQELRNSGLLEEIGGPAYITQLTRRVASAAHVESHARIIAQKYYLRESIRLANETIRLAFEDEDIELIASTWKQNSESLDNIFTVTNTGSHIKQVLIDTVTEIEKDCKAIEQKKSAGIPTGFPSLDLISGGWRSGNLIVLAARPGVGKTSFALSFALAAARNGYWVNIFSLEMNKEDLARILMSTESNVYRSRIRDGNLNQTDWQQINSAVGRLEKLPIIFRDAAGLTVSQIKSAIQRNRKNGRCDFAIVDYLQLVKSQQPKALRELEVSEVSRTLKTTALNEGIPILALSQLNRESEKKAGPQLSDLRESGAIEQDSDMVIFLMNDEKAIRVQIAKHRRGRLGDFNVYHDGQMTKFSEEPFNKEVNSFPHPDSRIEKDEIF